MDFDARRSTSWFEDGSSRSNVTMDFNEGSSVTRWCTPDRWLRKYDDDPILKQANATVSSRSIWRFVDGQYRAYFRFAIHSDGGAVLFRPLLWFDANRQLTHERVRQENGWIILYRRDAQDIIESADV